MITPHYEFKAGDFADKDLRAYVLEGDRSKYGNISQSLDRKLRFLAEAETFKDFKAVVPKAKQLSDKSLGFGVPLDKGLRLCFRWDKSRPHNLQITQHYDKKRKR